MPSDSIQWDWKRGFCRKHIGQFVPCPICIETLDDDLVREEIIAEVNLGGSGAMTTAAEARIIDERRVHRANSEVSIPIPSEKEALTALKNKTDEGDQNFWNEISQRVSDL